MPKEYIQEKIMPHALAYYLALKKAQGLSWDDVKVIADEFQDKLGKESYGSTTSVKNRVNAFKKRFTETFGVDIIVFLDSLDGDRVLLYLLGNLMVEYEEARLNGEDRKAAGLVNKIVDIVLKRHQMRGVSEDVYEDDFSKLILKHLQEKKEENKELN